MQIPSPVQEVKHPVFEKVGISCYLKRDDLIHPVISGNKWRKLKYNIESVKAKRYSGFVTFGGAFSNHLAASAFAAKAHGLRMVAIIRGKEERMNTTLDFVKACGAELVRVPRSTYAVKDEPDYLIHLQNQYPDHMIIPEGGANLYGVRGCMEIGSELIEDFDILACPLGSATTFSGLILGSDENQKLIGFPSLKGGDYLERVVHNFISQAQSQDWLPSSFTPPEWWLETAYHFGGFGKVTPDFISFLNAFWELTGIPLDPIYTGKMMYGLIDKVKQGKINSGSKILALHTGGLQGIKGMNARLRKKNLEIVYEEAVSAAFTYPDN